MQRRAGGAEQLGKQRRRCHTSETLGWGEGWEASFRALVAGWNLGSSNG